MLVSSPIGVLQVLFLLWPLEHAGLDFTFPLKGAEALDSLDPNLSCCARRKHQSPHAQPPTSNTQRPSPDFLKFVLTSVKPV